MAGDTATMSAPGGRRSESELLKHRELKEAASPRRAATMCAEAGKIGIQGFLLACAHFVLSLWQLSGNLSFKNALKDLKKKTLQPEGLL